MAAQDGPHSIAHGLPPRLPDVGPIAGVCAGLSRALGVDPTIVRIAFIAATAATGVGVPLYLVAWLLMPVSRGDAGPPAASSLLVGAGWREAAGVGLLVLASMLVLRELGLWFSDTFVWPVVLAASGLAVLYRHLGGQGQGGSLPALLRLLPREEPGGRARTLLGVALVIGGGVAFLQATDAFSAARSVLLAAVVVLLGILLVWGPLWLRLLRSLAEERSERIRSQERAEIAAHLHDSVLQTLALIQRRADDPREVANLARRQERELRAWLTNRADREPGESLAAALEEVAAEIEDLHGVPVEVVTVGDCPVDERVGAVVAAAREALANAARFSGAATVSLYAEAGDDGRVSVFVRDRGAGFDLAAVPADRRGVRESILGRIERHGGKATVRAAPGEGTEVELTLEPSPPARAGSDRAGSE